jgi:hypothetical protein
MLGTMSTATATAAPSSVQAAGPTPTAELAARYRRDGFVNGGPLLDEAEVAVLRKELDRVIAEQREPGVPQPYRVANIGKAGMPVWQIVNIWQASAAFAAILRKPRLVELLTAMSGGGSELRLWHDQIQYKPAATGGVNWWHQDCPYWPPLTPADELHTAWIALDDADADNGCMSMVPGSHRWGDAIKHLEAQKDFHHLPADYQGNAVQAVLTPVKAGSVHFHHSYTWHGSQANTSGRPRRAIAFHVMTDRVRRKEGNHLLAGEIASAIGAPVRGPLFPLIAMG